MIVGEVVKLLQQWRNQIEITIAKLNNNDWDLGITMYELEKLEFFDEKPETFSEKGIWREKSRSFGGKIFFFNSNLGN